MLSTAHLSSGLCEQDPTRRQSIDRDSTASFNRRDLSMSDVPIVGQRLTKRWQALDSAGSQPSAESQAYSVPGMNKRVPYRQTCWILMQNIYSTALQVKSQSCQTLRYTGDRCLFEGLFVQPYDHAITMMKNTQTQRHMRIENRKSSIQPTTYVACQPFRVRFYTIIFTTEESEVA